MRGGGRQNDMRPSDKPEMFDDERRPDKPEMFDGENQPDKAHMWGNDGNRPGRPEMPGNGERPFESGEVQGQGNTLILLGISILVLLSGLLMAMKMKY